MYTHCISYIILFSSGGDDSPDNSDGPGAGGSGGNGSGQSGGSDSAGEQEGGDSAARDGNWNGGTTKKRGIIHV